MGRRGHRHLIRVLVLTFVLANLAMASIVVFHYYFDLTSSNSAFYIVRGEYGGLRITRDFRLDEADKVVYAVNVNRMFNSFMKGLAVARHSPVLELTWDESAGSGGIKQYRADGTMLSLSISRFLGRVKRPQGVFVGGELPFEDDTRSDNQNSSGLGYFDGSKWHHIWCTGNEDFSIFGEEPVILPPVLWDYRGSRILKNTGSEVVLESEHEARRDANRLLMHRHLYFRAGDDYFVLQVKFTNRGDRPVVYNYSWGDEPWVGLFGESRGDVGWYAGGLIKTERIVSPVRNRYVGYWDHGNDTAGEGGDFTGYANFVEWAPPLPSTVFFSNAFDDCCDEQAPLSSEQNRVVELVWLNQVLLAGESRAYTLAFGMARIDPESKMPVKPDTTIADVGIQSPAIIGEDLNR